ncbi:MAG: PKD domain-containing protein, partial [Ferruginibacter sp.]
FIWDFGDSSSKVVTGFNPVIHTYSGAGTYLVTLALNDTNFCNSPVDTQRTVRLSPQVKAVFITPRKGCVPYLATFQNNSLGGLEFLWDFGDGTTSTLETPPPHLYPVVGTYKIVLTAFDSTSCNKVHSDSLTISVNPVPTASFTYNPNPPQENTFTNFTNQSIGASIYLWNYGDGDTSPEENPRHLFNATDIYNVCLNAKNDAGCSDDTCMPVKSLINPLLDVPNAFTPGKFVVNSIVRVQGFGIKNMQWNVYNRWGQLIFESTSVKTGWDGTFKGKVQPVDVYTYTLDVIFSDGKKLRKTGDITLLR